MVRYKLPFILKALFGNAFIPYSLIVPSEISLLPFVASNSEPLAFQGTMMLAKRFHPNLAIHFSFGDLLTFLGILATIKAFMDMRVLVRIITRILESKEILETKF